MNAAAHRAAVEAARSEGRREQLERDILASCPFCRSVGPQCESAKRGLGGVWRHCVQDPRTGEWYSFACNAANLREGRPGIAGYTAPHE